MVAGSPTHLSPEAWKGSGDIDQRADVYALGVVLFRVLAGKLPFSGSIQELMFAVLGVLFGFGVDRSIGFGMTLCAVVFAVLCFGSLWRLIRKGGL